MTSAVALSIIDWNERPSTADVHNATDRWGKDGSFSQFLVSADQVRFFRCIEIPIGRFQVGLEDGLHFAKSFLSIRCVQPAIACQERGSDQQRRQCLSPPDLAAKDGTRIVDDEEGNEHGMTLMEKSDSGGRETRGSVACGWEGGSRMRPIVGEGNRQGRLGECRLRPATVVRREMGDSTRELEYPRAHCPCPSMSARFFNDDPMVDAVASSNGK